MIGTFLLISAELRQTVSIESAMTSREIREYFIPSVPIEIPSETVIVPKTCGIKFSSLAVSITASANFPKLALHGVIVL